jgi:hypothetical protein
VVGLEPPVVPAASDQEKSAVVSQARNGGAFRGGIGFARGPAE